MTREELIDTYGEEICKYCIETYLSDTNFPLGESCEGSHCECDFRIKPELKYRQFKDAEECWEEMLKHQPFGWIKCKEGYFNIVYVNDEYVGLEDKDDSAILLASINSYQDNTFADGTPFGVKVEE